MRAASGCRCVIRVKPVARIATIWREAVTQLPLVYAGDGGAVARRPVSPRRYDVKVLPRFRRFAIVTPRRRLLAATLPLGVTSLSLTAAALALAATGRHRYAAGDRFESAPL